MKEAISAAETDLYDMAMLHTRKWLEYERSFPQVPESDLGDFDFLSRIREQPEKYAFSFEVDRLAKPFPAPVLIVTGRQDHIVGYQDAWNLLENYPRATYVVLDRAGHQMEEKRTLVNILVNEWLDRVEEQNRLG